MHTREIGGSSGVGSNARTYRALAIPEFFVGDPGGGGLTANGTPFVADTGRFLANDFHFFHGELAGNLRSRWARLAGFPPPALHTCPPSPGRRPTTCQFAGWSGQAATPMPVSAWNGTVGRPFHNKAVEAESAGEIFSASFFRARLSPHAQWPLLGKPAVAPGVLSYQELRANLILN